MYKGFIFFSWVRQRSSSGYPGLSPFFPLSTAVVYQGGLFSDLHGSFAARCGRGGATVNLCESIELRGGRGGGPACLHRSKVANMSLV